MKQGTPDHPKMLHLASILGIPREHAVGIMELFWHWVARYAPAGDLGKHADDVVQGQVAPALKRKRLVEALVEARWVDKADWSKAAPRCFGAVEAGWPRLWVHDWHEHCEDRVRKHLEKFGLVFANGKPARTRGCSRTDRESFANDSRIDREPVSPRARVPEPEPEPEPAPAPGGGERVAFPETFEGWLLEFCAVPGYEVYKKQKRAVAERCWMETRGLVVNLPAEVVMEAWRAFLRVSMERAYPTPCSTWITFLEKRAPREGGGGGDGGAWRGAAALGRSEAQGMVVPDVDEDDAEARGRKRAEARGAAGTGPKEKE